MMLEDVNVWSRAVLGRAKLGDKRRTDRAVQMLSTLTLNPKGSVCASIVNAAEQKAAYRWLDTDTEDFDHQDVLRACRQATWRDIAEHDLVVVPIDITSHNLSDPARRRQGIGRIGKSDTASRGVHVASALAVTQGGSVVGLMAQTYFNRQPKAKNWKQIQARKADALETKESVQWVRVAQQVFDHDDDLEPCRLWLQCDRGADAHQVLASLDETCRRHDSFYSVRLAQNRRTSSTPNQPKLFELVGAQPVLATLELEISDKSQQRAARALAKFKKKVNAEVVIKPDSSSAHRSTIELECRVLKLELPLFESGKSQPYRGLEGSVVELRQKGAPSSCTDASGWLSWRIWTNFIVDDLEDLLVVVNAYKLRWRVEEFHRSWKFDCRVESQRLLHFERIARWASLNAMVAVRIERIKRLSREHPDDDALSIFSQAELDAIIALRHGPSWKRPDKITRVEATLWLAELGGYTKRKHSPPGSTTLARGMARIEPIVCLTEQGYVLKSRRSG